MKLKFYTTSTSSWYQKRCDAIAREWSRVKGIDEVTIDVVYKTIPNPFIIYDKYGKSVISWEWFESYLDDEEYDGIIFHFTPYYRKKWQMYQGYGGERNSHQKKRPMFWLCCEKEEWAEGYILLYRFDQLMYHEMAHFFEDLDDNNGNLLTQTSVHDFDYRLKKIHEYHLLVDMRGLEFRKKVDALLVKVINLAKKLLP